MTILKRFLKWVAAALALAVLVVVVLALIPIRPTMPRLERRDSTRYWQMSGGYRIAYTLVPADEATKPPVVYLHGGPGGYVHSSTIETVGRLARLGRDVYLYDQSGTGLSDRRPPKATTFDNHVRDLQEIVTRHIGAGLHAADEIPAVLKVVRIEVGRGARISPAEAPVLVLQGQCDYMPYASVFEYVDLFPNAEYRFIEKAGHIIWWDRPDSYVDTIATFLGDAPAQAPKPRTESACR